MIVGFIVLGSGGLGDPSLLARAVIYALAIFGSILVHELGHALVGRRLGLQPQRIVLHGFGGLCTYGRRPTPKQGVVSSLAGPLAGLALGALSFGALLAVTFTVGDRAPVGVRVLLEQLVWVNVVWSLFNLLPIHPLDGGSVMAHGLQLVTTPRRAWQITRWVTIGLAIPVALFGFSQGYTFVGIILALIVVQKIRG
jgi:stage IV sporulation protein FB